MKCSAIFGSTMMKKEPTPRTSTFLTSKSSSWFERSSLTSFRRTSWRSSSSSRIKPRKKESWWNWQAENLVIWIPNSRNVVWWHMRILCWRMIQNEVLSYAHSIHKLETKQQTRLLLKLKDWWLIKTLWFVFIIESVNLIETTKNLTIKISITECIINTLINRKDN